MTEKEEFRAVDEALRAFAADPPPVRPVGSAATRAFVRRRHQARVAVGVAALALAVSVPVVGYAALGPDGDHIASDPPSASSLPSPYPTLSSSPWVNPSPETIDEGSMFTVEQLRTMAFDIPAWGRGTDQRCPTGRFQMRGDYTPVTGGVTVQVVRAGVAHIDDGDPAFETGALLWCGTGADLGGEGQYQVVALDKGNPVRTLGQVVATSTDGPVRTIVGFQPSMVRGLDVVVGDGVRCCGGDWRTVEYQVRNYKLIDGRLVQIGGPTAFTPGRPGVDISVTAGDIGLQAGTVSTTGTTQIVVTNRSTSVAAGIWLQAYGTPVDAMPFPLTVALDVECSQTGGEHWRVNTLLLGALCHLPALAPGASRTIPLTVNAPNGAGLSAASVMVEAYEEQPGVRMLSDPRAADNVRTVRVKAA